MPSLGVEIKVKCGFQESVSTVPHIVHSISPACSRNHTAITIIALMHAEGMGHRNGSLNTDTSLAVVVSSYQFTPMQWITIQSSCVYDFKQGRHQILDSHYKIHTYQL